MDPLQPPFPENFQKEDETLESLLGNKGYILQKRRGYRFSLDAFLLAALVVRLQGDNRSKKNIRYLDLGTGSGIVPILLAKWNHHLAGYGVEIQAPLASMAQRNMQLQGLEARFKILCEDLKELPSQFPEASFDWITINPPYRRLSTGRVNPDPQKAMARHELAVSLPDICRVMGYLLRNKGKAYLIYPASRSVSLLFQLRSAGLEPKYMRPVYPKPGASAQWVLIEAVCGGKEALSVDTPLFVEGARGRYTEEVNTIFDWKF